MTWERPDGIILFSPTLIEHFTVYFPARAPFLLESIVPSSEFFFNTPRQKSHVLKTCCQHFRCLSTFYPARLLLLVAGLKQATTGLLQPSAFPASVPGPLLFVFPGVSQSASLPQSREHGEGMEEGAWEELRDGLEGLFEGGLWATSVKRKRVTKMRKHKWRKRRKAERQSASRRDN